MRRGSILSAAAAALVLVPVTAFAVDPVTNIQPSLGINYVIEDAGTNADDYGIIDMLPYNVTPVGSSEADGTLLPINPANATLYQQIGTTFGGDGVSTFQLPNLIGRVPIGVGQGAGLTNRNLGDVVGTDQETLTQANLPTVFNGQNAPLNNMQPSLALNYMIETQGVFPDRGATTGGPGGNALPFTGQIVPTAGATSAAGLVPCDGRLLNVADNTALFSILGTDFGGDGVTTFALPDLRGRAAVSVGGMSGQGLGLMQWFIGSQHGTESNTLSVSNLPPPAGSGFPFTNIQPSLGLNYIIALQGTFPQPTSGPLENESPLIGQIALFAGDYAPVGWALCAGQTLPIAQNSALYNLLGTTFGGDGVTNFELPDLDGRFAVAADVESPLDGLTPFPLGEKTGVEEVTLTGSQTPALPEPAGFASLAVGAFALAARRRRPAIV